jgi:hypothetical protein
MLRTLLFFLPICSVVLGATQIEWPLFANEDDFYLNLTIGTPGLYLI